MKKKIIAIALTLMALALCSCDNNDNHKSSETTESSTGYSDNQIQRECVMVNDKIYMFAGNQTDKLPEHFSVKLQVDKVDDYNLPKENLSACNMQEGDVLYASEQSDLCIYVEREGYYVQYTLMDEETKQQLQSNE